MIYFNAIKYISIIILYIKSIIIYMNTNLNKKKKILYIYHVISLMKL